MSEWTPRVGDKVMVGDCGPYEVRGVSHPTWCYLRVPPALENVPVLWSWLTPAPEPEPDEPTAPGALVRDGAGRLWVRDDSHEWPWGCLAPYGDDNRWAQLFRPITVVLADPAEVEQLREQVDALREARDVLRAERDAYRKAKQENDERFQLEAAAQRDRADELQRRIDAAQEWAADHPGRRMTPVRPGGEPALRRILRGES